MKDIFYGLMSLILILAIPLTLFAGWLTHVIHTIQSEEWVLLVAGAIMFPIAIVHGIGLWFGLF